MSYKNSNYQQEYRLKPEVKEKKKIHYLENQEKRKQYRKDYDLKNEKIVKEKRKIWRFINRDKIKQEKQEYYIKNKEKIKKRTKEWIVNNPKKMLKLQINYLTKLNKKIKLTVGEYRWILRAWSIKIKKDLGNQCIICGSKDRLNVHHIFHKSKHPKLSTMPNNGVPLCFTHHREVHGNFKGKKLPPPIVIQLSPSPENQAIILKKFHY